MTVKTTWSITRLERAKDSGIVSSAEYRVVTTDDEKADAVQRLSSINFEPPTGTPVAFKDITQDIAIKWVKDTLDAINTKNNEDGFSTKQLEDNLLNQLEARRKENPNHVSGLPWELTT
tara:strand:- start:89 stop:445 length:357 start_codon:yes stop_codon:yes gene_type:complete